MSPAPSTPRRSQRNSSESTHSVRIMETLVEDDEEKIVHEREEDEHSKNISLPVLKQAATPRKNNKKRTSRSRVSEVTQLEDIKEDDAFTITCIPTESTSNLINVDRQLSSPEKSPSKKTPRYYKCIIHIY